MEASIGLLMLLAAPGGAAGGSRPEITCRLGPREPRAVTDMAQKGRRNARARVCRLAKTTEAFCSAILFDVNAAPRVMMVESDPSCL